MATEYEQAVATLYQAGPEAFVSERQRLGAALKEGGDKAGATKLAKLARPALSAWAVNQLWWHARAEFEQLFETAQQLRAGKLAASAAHREAVAKLTRRAQRLLTEAQHPANETTLRRVTLTLSSLAAAGGFEPNLPGALARDREPAGFEAFGARVSEVEQAASEPRAKPDQRAPAPAHAPVKQASARRAAEHHAAEKARREAAARKRHEAEAHVRLVAEQREAKAALHSAKAALTQREAECAQAAKALAFSEKELERARSAWASAAQRVAALNRTDGGDHEA